MNNKDLSTLVENGGVHMALIALHVGRTMHVKTFYEPGECHVVSFGSLVPIFLSTLMIIMVA